MQLQILARRGPADARPEEERRGLDASAGNDHGRCSDRDRAWFAVAARPDRLDPRGAAVLDEDTLYAAVDHEARASVGSVLEVGQKRALLLALLAAAVAVSAEP